MKFTKRANHERLEDAFERYYPAIFRYFRYRGADVDTANDLASTTFTRALENLNRFDPHRAKIQTWLFAIARNLSVNHWKAAKPTIPLDDDLSLPAETDIEATIMFTQDKEKILLALKSLDERAREIIALKFGGPLTNRQIAELSGLTESNVGVILYRSLLKLRTLLATEYLEARHDR